MSDWQSIEDSPLDGTRVLVRHKVGIAEGSFRCSIAEFDASEGLWLVKPPVVFINPDETENKMGYAWFGEGRVVAWMPLPE